MPSDIIAKREERAKLIADARALLDKAESEKRELTAEEQEQFDRMWQEQDRLEDAIERQEKLAEAEGSLKKVVQAHPTAAAREDAPSEEKEEPARRAFRSYLSEGMDGLRRVEQRDLAATQFAAGGALVAPKQFVSTLLQKVANSLFVRQFATTYQLNQAQSLGCPTLETDPSDASWTNEVPAADPTADSTMAFGGRELSPSTLIKLIKVSNTLLRQALVDPEAIVSDALARIFGQVEENGFLNGNGAKQPLGIFTASAQGISTGRDVSTGNTTSAITFDGLIEAEGTLDEKYLTNARWIFHKDAIKMLRKIKDGEGRYVWQANVQAGAATMLLDRPFHKSAYCPNTWTTGKYVGMLGDLSFYWIADSLELKVTRLVETYALRRQVGFLAEKECDGMPVLEEAFVRVKLA